MGMIASAMRMAFSKPAYIVIAAAVAVTFWMVFNAFDQLLFFSPVLAFYVPSGAVLGFVVSTVTAVFLGLVAGMNAFALSSMRAGRKVGAGSLLSGSSLATLSSACVGCSSVGPALVSALGGTGLAATTILSVYQIPLRLVSLAILVWAFYSTSRKITGACALGP